MTEESQFQAQVLLELSSRPDTRLFRNNVGNGWVGRLLRRYPNGDVLLGNARPLHAGLLVGSGDLIGWHSREIQEADVGQVWGRFFSVECKTLRGVTSPEQLQWLTNVRRAGGIATVARTVEQAIDAIENVHP